MKNKHLCVCFSLTRDPENGKWVIIGTELHTSKCVNTEGSKKKLVIAINDLLEGKEIMVP
jgi:hypothetical protein